MRFRDGADGWLSRVSGKSGALDGLVIGLHSQGDDQEQSGFNTTYAACLQESGHE